MTEIDLDSLKKIQIKILNYVTEFCEKNSINYWLDSGTLLGAPFILLPILSYFTSVIFLNLLIKFFLSSLVIPNRNTNKRKIIVIASTFTPSISHPPSFTK